MHYQVVAIIELKQAVGGLDSNQPLSHTLDLLTVVLGSVYKENNIASMLMEPHVPCCAMV